VIVSEEESMPWRKAEKFDYFWELLKKMRSMEGREEIRGGRVIAHPDIPSIGILDSRVPKAIYGNLPHSLQRETHQ
jgi:hypothetical protein